MMKIYAGYIAALGFGGFNAQPTALVATSKEAALDTLYRIVYQEYPPPKQGFSNHFCNVVEVTDTIYQKADGYTAKT